ncbi:MAG: sodium:solute symporter family protein [Lachnospiraceae bacterium]|nr:sodium:solute symporter family protein [Lachnospiraceae bacterium]
MNIYLIGMAITMVLYVVIGALISRRVKNTNDFYVAGRNAPAYLITGSLVASFIGVGLFMGDVGEAYSGFFAPIMVAVGVLSVGYVVGSVFFGRYLRRSEAVTIPQYFGQRFDSKAMQKLAMITGTIIMLIYSLSCVQGIATLMTVVTGIAYNWCIVMAVVAFTLITVFSGAKGVLITDTIMFAVFSVATIVGVAVIANAAGGWTNTVTEMATYQVIPDILAGSGNLNYFYPTGTENMIWACGYGIAWMSVLMVAPWQSSRYLMAKNEHAVIRSSVVASVSVFFIEFLMCMAGVFTNKLNPGMENPPQALIWAAINIMPAILGIIVLSGVLASGISSATTFLSLISSNITNDIAPLKKKDGKANLLYGRLVVLGVGVIICLLCVFYPPQIFWITYLGATVVACSWLPVAIASVWSKRVTKAGAFAGMLVGFVVSAVMKIYTGINHITLPIYFDPFFIGMAAGIIALIIGSAVTKVTPAEKEQRAKLFIMPESEKNPKEIKKTKIMIAISIPLGVVVTVVMLVLWVIPYLNGLK